MRQTWKLSWRWKSWKFITLPFRLSFMYPPSKKNNDQYLTMLYLQLPLSNTLRNFEFVYLKSDFAYLILSWCFIISRFFLDNQDNWTLHCKTLEPILQKEVKLGVLFLPHHNISCWGNCGTCSGFPLTISKSVG